MIERPILIAGRNGQLGSCLRDAAALRGLSAVALGREDLDLEVRDGIDRTVASIAPCMIINAAAYTAVDLAESEVGKAFSINRDGAAALADVAWQRNVPFVHLSTDYVFDGAKREAYDEADVPAPFEHIRCIKASRRGGRIGGASPGDRRQVVVDLQLDRQQLRSDNVAAGRNAPDRKGRLRPIRKPDVGRGSGCSAAENRTAVAHR